MANLLNTVNAQVNALQAEATQEEIATVQSIKPYKIQSLPIKQKGYQLHQLKMKGEPNETYTKSEIGLYAALLQKKLLEASPRLQTDHRVEMMVNNFYDQSIAWQAGKWREWGELPDQYDFNSQYEVDGVKLQEEFNRFNLLIKVVPIAGGCYTEAQKKLNHCLFDSIKKALNAVSMPFAINTPWKVKKVVGVGERDKVNYKKIPMIEEACKGKLAINLTGDGNLQSTVENPDYVVNLKLYKGHYEIDESNTKKDGALLKGYFPNHQVKHIAIYDPKLAVLYDGEKVIDITFPMKDWSRNDTMYFKITLLANDKQELEDKMEAEYEKMHTISEVLKHTLKQIPFDYSERCPSIDILRGQTPKAIAFYLFSCFNTHVKQRFQALSKHEAIWIQKAAHGGILYAEPGNLEKAYSYDLNKMYSYLLQGEYPEYLKSVKCGRLWGFPCTEGTYHILKEIQDYPKMGIYRCVIKGEHKLFRAKKTNHYTHFDIATAREIGLEVEMIMDGHFNALVYDNERTTKTKDVFGPFFKHMKKYFTHVDPEEKDTLKYLKLIMNSLWGGLCEKNMKWIDVNKDEPLDMEKYEIAQLEPANRKNFDDERYRAQVEHRSQYYMTAYARIGPFITACGRRLMYKQLSNVQQYVQRIHTDGFISNKRLKLDFGPEWGQWKLEKKGKCQIHHVNSQDWS